MGMKPPPLPPRGKRELPPPRKQSPSVEAIPNPEAGEFADTEAATAKQSIHTELALLASYYRLMPANDRVRLMKAAEFFARNAPKSETKT